MGIKHGRNKIHEFPDASELPSSVVTLPPDAGHRYRC